MIWTSLARFMLRAISYEAFHHLRQGKYPTVSTKLNGAKIERLHQTSFNASNVNPKASDIHSFEML